MTIVKKPLLFLFHSLSLTLLLASAEFIATPTGRLIPAHVVRTHPFALSGHSVHHHSTQLYDLSEHGLLSGHGLSINIRKLASSRSPLIHNPRLQVKLNGKPFVKPLPSAVRYSGNGFSVLYIDGDKHPSSITGPFLHLVALHPDDFPGVYIRSFTPVQKDIINLQGDELPMPGSSLLEPSPSTSPAQSNPNDITSSTTTRLTSEHDSSLSLTNIFRQAGQCSLTDQRRFLELSLAFDNSLCARFGNSISRVLSELQNLVTEASVPFTSSFCVGLSLVHVDAHCQDSADPYQELTSFRGTAVLQNFRRIFLRENSSVQRDAVVLVSGFQDGTSTAGVAFVRATCSNGFDFGWTEGLERRVFAHEVGHLLGARHSPTGLMSAVLSSSTPLEFAEVSVSQMRNFLEEDSRSACLETTARTCGSECDGECVQGVCVKQNAALSESPTPSASAETSSSPSALVSSSPVPTTTPSADPSSSPSALPSSSSLPTTTPTASAIPSSSSSALPSMSAAPSTSSIPTMTASALPSTTATAIPSTTALAIPSLIALPPPPSSSPSSLPLPSMTPTSSPDVVAPRALPSTPPRSDGTCGSTFPTDTPLSCVRRRRLLRVRTGRRRRAVVLVSLAIESGLLRVDFSVLQGSVSLIVVGAAVGRRPNELRVAPLIGDRASFSMDVNALSAPGRRGCCGQDVFVNVRVEACGGGGRRRRRRMRRRGRRTRRRCRTRGRIIPIELDCRDVCRGGVGRRVPMTSTNRCPICL